MLPSDEWLRLWWQWTQGLSFCLGLPAVKLFGLSMEQDFSQITAAKASLTMSEQQLLSLPSALVIPTEGGTGFGRAGIYLSGQ